jgi:Spx/MgsR family transcriptional regulator
MTLKVYGLKKCSTCEKAEDWLKSNKVAYSFTDVKDDGISAEQVKGWIKALGSWDKLVNRAGYTWRGLSEDVREGLTDAKAVQVILANPSLIRRPLVEHGGGAVTVGFSEKVKAAIA